MQEKSITEVVAEVITERSIESARGQNVTRIRIEIDPPELGEVSIEISKLPNQTIATIVVANEYAQQQLQGNIQQLQVALEAMGVEFRQVDLEQNSFDQSGANNPDTDSQSRDQTNDKTTKQSELANKTKANGKSEAISIRSVHVVDFLV